MPHTPEQLARQEIDLQLVECGWLLRESGEVGASASPGMAVRQFPINRGYVDYLLIVDETNCAVITVAPSFISREPGPGIPTPAASAHLPSGAVAFAYLSTGTAIRFTSCLQRVPRCDEVTRFHTPRELLAIARVRESATGRRRRSWMDGLSVFDALMTARRRGQSAAVGDMTDVLDRWSCLTQVIDLASSVNSDWTEAGEELFQAFFGHELCARFLGLPTDTGRDDLTFTQRNPWAWIVPYHRRGHPLIAPLFDRC